MYLNRILISTFAFIVSVVFFYLLNSFLQIFTEFHSVLSFAVTLFLVLIFKNPISNLLKKVVSTGYFGLVNRTLASLDTLNSELNKAIRYKEVTGILFKSFRSLFKDIPYAFYIAENAKFTLENFQFIDDKEIVDFDIDAKDLDISYLGQDNISIKETSIPKSIKKRMLASGLTTIIPFPGRVKLFAFLVIDHKKLPFKKAKDPMERFRSIQNKAGVILENTALFVDIEQKNYQIRKIIEISNQILSSFDIKNILDFILKSVQSIYNYDSAAIYLLDKSGKRLLRTSSRGYDAELLEKLHLKVGQGSCGWVVETGKINVLNDVDGDEHYFKLREKTRSQVSIPLVHAEDVIGVLCLESNRLAFFNDSMVDNLQLFAQLAAIAIFNSLQVDTLLTKRALENDLIDAGIVQKKLLVQNFPNVDKLKVYATNIPSKIVSGDLYDIIRYNQSTIAVAIGDVSGKGAPASLMMSLILAGLRTQKKSFLTACDMVYRLNNLLTDATIESSYATFFYGVFSLDNSKFIYTNAGHDAPMLIKADGQIQILDQGGIVLGYLPDWEYIQAEVPWETGDLLVAFTDGVTETMNSAQEEFGRERLTEIVLEHRQLNVYDIKNKITKAIEEYAGTDAPDDDITIVICKNE